MRLQEVNTGNIVQEISKVIQNQEEVLGYMVVDEDYVSPGYHNEFNREFCEKNNIKICPSQNQGGVLFISKGDFEIGLFSKDTENKFHEEFAKVLKDYLVGKGINCEYQGNDLIADGQYKVTSFSTRRYGDILFSAFHIAINMNLEMIQAICLKPMVKVPKGLADYGVTTDEIKALFLGFAKDII